MSSNCLTTPLLTTELYWNCHFHFKFEANKPISVVPNLGIGVETSKESAHLSLFRLREKGQFPG